MGLIDIFKPLSTILKPAPLINLSNIDNFSSENFWEYWEIKPGAAGWEASVLPLCYAAPSYHKTATTNNGFISGSGKTGNVCSGFGVDRRRQTVQRPLHLRPRRLLQEPDADATIATKIWSRCWLDRQFLNHLMRSSPSRPSLSMS